MLWKVLSADGRSCHGGDAQWSLPRGKRPGAWMPRVEVDPCYSGYHLCRRGDLLDWLGPAIWEAEGRGVSVTQANKVVFAEARLVRRVEAWDEHTARLFSADCAARVLHLYERAHPTDPRPRDAILAARRFARGEIGAAAKAAARAAAWAASGDAAWAASGDAARAAAWDAARAAAWDAAMVAAWDAARAAAMVAAMVAAWDAAWDAARAAARAASGAAERSWQTRRLHAYLRGAVRRDVPLPKGAR